MTHQLKGRGEAAPGRRDEERRERFSASTRTQTKAARVAYKCRYMLISFPASTPVPLLQVSAVSRVKQSHLSAMIGHKNFAREPYEFLCIVRDGISVGHRGSSSGDLEGRFSRHHA